MSSKSQSKVVILGGGFAGLRVLYHLADKAQITLIDPRSMSLTKPDLPEVAFAGKPVDHARFALAPLASRHHAMFIQQSAMRIDPEAKVVVLSDGVQIPYDYLVIATGAVKDYDAIPGFREHGYSVCDDTEAPRLAQALARFSGGPIVTGAAQSYFSASSGAPSLSAPCEGPIGEVLFMLDRDLRKRNLREVSSITAFTPGKIFFEDVGDKVHAVIGPQLDRAGISVTAGLELVEIMADRVRFKDGTEMESALSIVIPPYRAASLIAESGLGDDQGYFLSDREMRHVVHHEIFSAGDASALSMPKLGHIAVHQADIVAASIRKALGEKFDVPEFAPEVFCIMNQGGPDATLILSDTLFGHDTDIAWSNPAAHMFKWSFDNYYYYTHGHMPPEVVQRPLVAALHRLV